MLPRGSSSSLLLTLDTPAQCPWQPDRQAPTSTTARVRYQAPPYLSGQWGAQGDCETGRHTTCPQRAIYASEDDAVLGQLALLQPHASELCLSHNGSVVGVGGGASA